MSDPWLCPPTQAQRDRALALAARAGHTPQAGEDLATFWQRIPVADAVDHRSTVGTGDPASGARIFFSSGGSTGTQRYTLLRFSEVLDNSAIHGRGYAACGIGPDHVVATWGLPGIMSSEFTVYVALAATGACIVPIGDTAPDLIIQLVRDFGATTLLVMPSDLTPIMTRLEQTGEQLDAIRLVVTGGEPLFPADTQRFRARLGASVEFRSVFQTSDNGTIGYQCQACGFGEYHVHDDLQLVEIVASGPDGTGDLVTTSLVRELVPALRLRTGDRAVPVTGTCPCGRASPRIRLTGRAGRYVKFGGEKLDLESLISLKEKLGVTIDDFQAILERDELGRDRFVLHSNRVFGDPRLQELSTSLFAELGRKLASQLDHGIVGRLAFAPLMPGEAWTSANGKTQFFADRRG